MSAGSLPPLEFAVIDGKRHWPCGDGNYIAGYGAFTERENLLADWIMQLRKERDELAARPVELGP